MRLSTIADNPIIEHFVGRGHAHLRQHNMPSLKNSRNNGPLPCPVKKRSFFLLQIVIALAVIVPLAGCGQKIKKAIPAALNDTFPTRIQGKIARAWGGDNFEFGQQQQLHYFFITGVDCPEPGQHYYEQARQHLLDTCADLELEMEVIGYDDLKREIGHVQITDANGQKINLAIDLLERGLAWFDGNEFEGAERYREAMETARAKKIGIWSQPNPTPPWEFWQQQVEALK